MVANDNNNDILFTEQNLKDLISLKKGADAELKETWYTINTFNKGSKEYQDAIIKRRTALFQLRTLRRQIASIEKNGYYREGDNIVIQKGGREL